MYKGIGGSSGYGIGKIVIIKNDMPVYEIKSPENKENEIKINSNDLLFIFSCFNGFIDYWRILKERNSY